MEGHVFTGKHFLLTVLWLVVTWVCVAGQGGSGTTSTASSRRSSGGGPVGGGVPVLGGNGSPVAPRVSKGPTSTVWSNLASMESSGSLVTATPAPVVTPAPEPQIRESSPASMNPHEPEHQVCVNM